MKEKNVMKRALCMAFALVLALALVPVNSLKASAATLKETVTASYVDYSEAYPNYNDADWGMVKDAKFTIEFYDDNTLIVKNWMNQNVDLCIKYDDQGYIESVYNPGGTPSYWAYCDNTYYLYVACKAYSSTNSWVDLTNKKLYIQGSWGTTWDVNYCLTWASSASNTPEAPQTGEANTTIYVLGIMLIALSATAVVSMKNRRKEEL